MKTKIILTIFILTISISQIIFAQEGNYSNPAAAYCAKMGYTYQIENSSDGSQKGVCILPDASKVDAWDFYYGKVKKEYSYCSRKGYFMETKTIIENGFTQECPYCSIDLQQNKSLCKDSLTEIPMTELMEKNGEPLFNPSSTENNPDNNIPTNYLPENLAKATPPVSFDWRNFNGHSYIGPVRDQGTCGSCYAFAATACAEGAFNKATELYDGNRKSFSESFVMWCLGGTAPYNAYFGGCNGSSISHAELDAVQKLGVCENSLFPFTPTNPGTCTHWNDASCSFSNWGRAYCSDIIGIKQAIMNYGVVEAYVYLTPSFNNYTGGIYSDANRTCDGTQCQFTTVNHAVNLVGWGYDATYGDYWILRNSWGSTWGESGYMRIQATSAKVACSVLCLVPSPVKYKAENITWTTGLPNSGFAEFYGRTGITFKAGFTSGTGTVMNARITSAALQPATTITLSFNSLSRVGNFTFSTPNDSSQTISERLNEITVFPNPVIDFVNFTDINSDEIKRIDLFNSKGEIVKSNLNISATPVSIDFSNIPSGMYIIRVQIGNEFYAKRIIKQ